MKWLLFGIIVAGAFLLGQVVGDGPVAAETWTDDPLNVLLTGSNEFTQRAGLKLIADSSTAQSRKNRSPSVEWYATRWNGSASEQKVAACLYRIAGTNGPGSYISCYVDGREVMRLRSGHGGSTGSGIQLVANGSGMEWLALHGGNDIETGGKWNFLARDIEAAGQYHLSIEDFSGNRALLIRQDTRVVEFSQAPKFNSVATGGTTTWLGTNSPATQAAPYTWIRVTAADGTPVFVPAWK